MKKEYEALFTPIRIGKVEIRNRFAMAPMAMGQLDDHWAYKQESIDYFTERARGGTGLIITGPISLKTELRNTVRQAFHVLWRIRKAT